MGNSQGKRKRKEDEEKVGSDEKCGGWKRQEGISPRVNQQRGNPGIELRILSSRIVYRCEMCR